MKYIKTFNNHETYELNLLVDYPTLSHCQTEEHIHLTPPNPEEYNEFITV